MSGIVTNIYERNGRLWALGGKAFPVARDKSPSREAVRERKHYDATHAVFSDGMFSLYDLNRSATRRGFRRVYSAALVLRDGLTTEHPHVFAAFDLADGCYYLLAIVNRRIMVQGDQILASETDAKAFFASYGGIREWGSAYKIAPKRWGIAGARETGLGAYLDAAKPGRAHRLTRPFHLSAMVTVPPLAAAAAAYWFGLPLLAPPPVQAPRMSTAVAAEWERLPLDAPRLAGAALRCEAMRAPFYERQPPGWPMVSFTCGGSSASGVFTRTDGAPFRFASMALDDATPSADAADTVPLTVDQLPGRRKVEAALRDAAGTLRATVEINVRQPALNGDPSSAPPPPPWTRLEWSFTTSAPSSLWLEPLAALPATTLRGISIGAAGATKIEGTTYVLR
jgi:hypothetical protein